ncbi:FHA domain-containing protein [Streptomyces sp. NPDC002928]|uniref:FHA domain-containing protein n=1 Tax=Streptomyces sp. NPDC002928 TaxID=3154440 RepID=UPI0033A91CC6
MQIRLTVVDPLGPPSDARGRATTRDVLVTAPAGTALAAVASALASAVSGDAGASSPHERGRESGGGPVVLYAGAERLDAQRCTLGEPPLVDGAVLSLGAPAEPEPHPELDDAPAQLHVVAGPDAGGVHLLHGGQVTIGRSADADVPLDDPDVSRLHCAVTLAPDGRVSVSDLGSTNGTALDGTRVHTRPVRFAPGALLRIGESALRLAPAGGPGARVATTPDGEGHVRVPRGDGTGSAAEGAGGRGDTATAPGPAPGAARTRAAGSDDDVDGSAGSTGHRERTGSSKSTGHRGGIGSSGGPGDRERTGSSGGAGDRGGASTAPTRVGAVNDEGSTDGSSTGHAYGSVSWGASGTAPGARAHGPVEPPVVPVQGGAPRIESHGAAPNPVRGDGGQTHAGRFGAGGPGGTTDAGRTPTHPPASPAPHPTDEPQATRKRAGGLTAWARRLAGGRGAPGAGGHGTHDEVPEGAAAGPSAVPPRVPETWPDPAALLLTALGPGPRLWERGPGHPETLTVRLGTTDRTAPDGSGPLSAVPVTADLREAGALGLAGPRPRLSGLARAVVAQLTALHSPDALEIVLVSADRSRSLEERIAEWSWLGWLPHVRPGHGQDCRLLLAYDREQAAARTDELLRRLEDHLADPGAAPRPSSPYSSPSASPRRPSWAQDADDTADAADGFPGPYSVVVVDGDPGGADLREAVARLTLEGPRAGIHVVCLAETAPASPASPVTDTYEAACAVAPVFRECGAVALLSGDVATALHLMRVGRITAEPPRHGPVGHGTVAAVDAVSLAWAERFGRALAPLRPDGAPGERHTRVSVPLPQAARLLDELGLARATPASLMARWADAADDKDALGGRAWAVLGAGPRGPVGVDLVAEGPHLLIEGPAGSGRTELLRAVVASLAAAERPDRLGIVLMDGRDNTGGAGGGHGDGLRVCTDVPHVTTHLTANDPVRMREFAQSLSAELKRRAELLGRSDFAAWHTHREVSGRIVAQRTASARGTSRAGTGTGTGADGAGDLDAPPSSTIRLRPGAARQQSQAAPPMPRLVVVVDDLDALVSPALGSPGRPAAGSVMRALEAVAREGERLGVHLVAATGPGGRTAETEPARRAALRVTLEAPASGTDEPTPGRGYLTGADGRPAPFQGGRVTGRIPRTATLRPTVVPLDWHRMGDPPARRPVRELGNGPTDLALLASALERAAREVSAAEVPSLL